jgi:hypothetical protein
MDRITINQDVRRDLATQGFAWIPRAAWSMGSLLQPHWHRLTCDWDQLELDRYLESDAAFRLRRYGRYSWSPAEDTLISLPDEPYFQPREQNPRVIAL